MTSTCAVPVEGLVVIKTGNGKARHYAYPVGQHYIVVCSTGDGPIVVVDAPATCKRCLATSVDLIKLDMLGACLGQQALDLALARKKSNPRSLDPARAHALL